MPQPRRPLPRHAGQSIWAVLGFLTLFAGLIVFVSFWYLFPAMAAAQHATHSQRREMAAHALLLMAVMLVILLCGLLLTFRIGRFFFPRPTPKRTRTQYVDAWAEAGRRAALGDDVVPDDKTYEDGDDPPTFG